MKTEEKSSLYGMMAEFETPEELIAATKRAREAGYRKMDGFTPFPVEGMSEALAIRDKKVPLITLLGGLFGCTAGLTFQWYTMVHAYPVNVGGRPLWSWPLYIPVAFEFTIFCAAFSGIFGMIILNKLPQPYHPVFNVPNFDRASSDRFFLCIESVDKKFDRTTTREFMQTLGAQNVSEVEGEF